MITFMVFLKRENSNAKHLVNNAYLDYDYLGEASEAIREYLKGGKLW